MKTDYGQDAPGLLLGFLIAGVLLLAGAIGLWVGATAHRLGAVLGLVSLYPLGMAGLMVFYSRVTKLADRDQMLDRIDWSKIHVVVDLGCGRGLLTIGAARRMADGMATGVDIWNAADQSGNTAAAALQNAEIVGVAARVRFVTADMRQLPMADGSVDLIVSAWAIHNLADAKDRRQALAEAVRVLSPDGTILISDIACLSEYQTILTGMGFATERREFGRWRSHLLPTISFGSFGPAMLIARRA